MLCDKCQQNPASVFITKMVNDQKTEYKLCLECAKKEQLFPGSIEGPVSVDSLLKGFFGASQATLPESENAAAACPACGMTLGKLAEKGRFGCSECYNAFGDTALKTIKRIHGRKRHIGKMPKRTSGALSMKRKLKDLRTELEEHVIREEYEEAAKLRDEIRALEKELAAPTEVENDTK